MRSEARKRCQYHGVYEKLVSNPARSSSQFDKVKKISIDWYCDNVRCEFRNFKLMYVCEMCGQKHDPKVDEEETGGKAFFKRRAR